MRKRTIPTIALAFAATIAACGRSDNTQADTTLNRDLSLAAQANQPYDSLSAAERTAQANALNAPATPTAATSSGARRATPRGTTSHRSSSGGEVVRSSSAGVSTSSSSGTVVKHTKRDAAIGAAAGAVIGATTSHNKIKGGIIGAAVGGLLGGVIGNNVDKTKKKPE
jgi:Glycine zipper